MLETPDGPSRFFVVFFAALALSLLIQPIIEATHFIPIARAYNEGWNAYHALAIRAGQNPYPIAGAGLANNYPPLSFAIAASVSRLAGNADLILVGRFIALVSLIVLICSLYLVLRIGQVRLWLAASLSLATLCLIGATARVYVAVNDPQWLAQALSFGGAALLLLRPQSGAAVIASAALMVAGGFSKEIVVAIPCATALWLLLQYPRMLLKWILAAGASLAAAAALCAHLYGSAFFAALFATPRSFSLSLGIHNLTAWASAIVPVLAFTIAAMAYLLRRRRQTPVETFALCYLGASLAWLPLMLCGAGIWINSLFVPLIACALIIGCALEAMLRSGVRLGNTHVHATHAISAIMSIAIAALGIARLSTAFHELGALNERGMETQKFVARLASERDAVSCETLALCFWAGRSVDFDYFNLGQEVLTQDQSLRTAVSNIRGQKYGVLQFSVPGKLGSYRLPQVLNNELATWYRIAETASIGTLAVRTKHPQ